MEKTLVLKTEKREVVGKKASQKVRQSNRIPAIIYGHKQEPVTVTLDKHNFTEGLHHGHRLIELQIGRKKENVIVKDLQYDYLGKDIIHADLMRVSATEKVKVNVPVETKGMASEAGAGVIVEERLDHIEVECLATDIPEKYVVRIDSMHAGDNIVAGDIDLGEGVTLVTSPEDIVISCHTVAAAKEVEVSEEEEPTAPEVIGEKKEESEESGQESEG